MPRIAARVEPLGAGVTRVTIDVAPATPHTVAQEATAAARPLRSGRARRRRAARRRRHDTLQGVRTGRHAADARDRSRAALRLVPRRGSARADAGGGAHRHRPDRADRDAAARRTPPARPRTAASRHPDTPPLLDLPPAGGLRAIVIDAGHGGDDTGAKGAQGTLEKNVTLSVARRLKAAIEARLGVRVLLTRDGDQAVAVGPARGASRTTTRRTCSSACTPTRRCGRRSSGAEVFYLNLERLRRQAQRALAGGRAKRCPSSAAAAARSRSRRGRLAQARHIEQSAVFARAIEGALRERVADEPARAAAGAVPRPRRRQHAGGAGRDGLPHQRAAGAAARERRAPERRSCRRCSTASSATAPGSAGTR